MDFCLRCKKETPTKDIHYETLSRKTKSGKTVNQTLMRGICGACGTKKTKFVKASGNHAEKQHTHHKKSSMSESESKTESEPEHMHHSHMHGEGMTHRVEKRDISKRTYTALKELIKSGKAGYLTFGNTKYYVSPVHVGHFKTAHEKGLLKKAAQVMSGERSHHDVKEKLKAKGHGMDSLNILSDILGVVGMLL